MKTPSWIKDLSYDDHLLVQGFINRGADYALVYFWFNLRFGHYWPAFTLQQVEKEVKYFSERDPGFSADIKTWFETFKSKFYAPTSTEPISTTQQRAPYCDSQESNGMRSTQKGVSFWKRITCLGSNRHCPGNPSS